MAYRVEIMRQGHDPHHDAAKRRKSPLLQRTQQAFSYHWYFITTGAYCLHYAPHHGCESAAGIPTAFIYHSTRATTAHSSADGLTSIDRTPVIMCKKSARGCRAKESSHPLLSMWKCIRTEVDFRGREKEKRFPAQPEDTACS